LKKWQQGPDAIGMTGESILLLLTGENSQVETGNRRILRLLSFLSTFDSFSQIS